MSEKFSQPYSTMPKLGKTVQISRRPRERDIAAMLDAWATWESVYGARTVAEKMYEAILESHDKEPVK